MLGYITLVSDPSWRGPADINAWVDQLVEDYQAGAIIEQHASPFVIQLVLRRRWAGQIAFGTMNVVPNKLPLREENHA